MSKTENEIASGNAVALLPTEPGVREFAFPGSTRRIAIHRKSIAFVVEAEQPGRSIIGFHSQARPCPVDAPYDDVHAWWRKRMTKHHGEGTHSGPAMGDAGQNGHPPNQTGTIAEPKRRSRTRLSLPSNGVMLHVKPAE